MQSWFALQTTRSSVSKGDRDLRRLPVANEMSVRSLMSAHRQICENFLRATARKNRNAEKTMFCACALQLTLRDARHGCVANYFPRYTFLACVHCDSTSDCRKKSSVYGCFMQCAATHAGNKVLARRCRVRGQSDDRHRRRPGLSMARCNLR